jgi:hypothetical protein
MGSGVEVCANVLLTIPMLADPFVPEATLMSLETEIEVAGAKNVVELNNFGSGTPPVFGFVTNICPAFGAEQPDKGPLMQKFSVTWLKPVPEGPTEPSNVSVSCDMGPVTVKVIRSSWKALLVPDDVTLHGALNVKPSLFVAVVGCTKIEEAGIVEAFWAEKTKSKPENVKLPDVQVNPKIL